MNTVVIVGAGHGGLQAAASLRADGFSGEILLFGAEAGLPYHRPPLSKAFMDHGDAERLHLRPQSFFAEQAIGYRPDTTIDAIHPAQREVVTQDGARIAYDHLILATGSLGYRPPIPGATLPGILSLRRLDEANALRARLAPGLRALVLGAGFIGLEFAAMARQKGLAVTVLETAPRVLARVVSPPISAVIEARHRAAGIDIRLGVGIAAILPDQMGQARIVELDDGEKIEADILLMATGARPNTALAEAAGLVVANGVMVDEYLTTSDPGISALGDCASFPDPFGQGPVRLESVQAANDHARCIAAKLTGQAHTYQALPWFWSDQGDLKLQIAGFDGRREIAPDDVHLKALGDGRFVACRFEAGHLKAVETMSAPAQHMAARKFLASGSPLLKADVLAADGDLQSLLRALAA